MNTNYKLLNEGEDTQPGDQYLHLGTGEWSKIIHGIGNMVTIGDLPLRRAIWSYEEMPLPQHRIQVTELQLGLLHELVDIKYHTLTSDCKHNDEYADILLRLDDSEEVI